jgi:hypothetical protein
MMHKGYIVSLKMNTLALFLSPTLCGENALRRGLSLDKGERYTFQGKNFILLQRIFL